jgi:hypothetical protein
VGRRGRRAWCGAVMDQDNISTAVSIVGIFPKRGHGCSKNANVTVEMQLLVSGHLTPQIVQLLQK